MYCKKCGKEMRQNDYFCPACGAENFTTVYDNPSGTSGNNNTYSYNTESSTANRYYPPEEQEKDRKHGIGGAIVAVIMAGVTMFMLMLMVLTLATESIGIMAAFLIIALGTGIVALVFGLKSIFAFRDMVHQGKAKPVATLVMGIIGAATGAETLVGILLGAMEALMYL